MFSVTKYFWKSDRKNNNKPILTFLLNFSWVPLNEVQRKIGTSMKKEMEEER